MDDLVRLFDLLGADEHTEGAANTDAPLAIATVVNTSGSAYRRPGARMVIRQSMAVQGAVSAGCLERDIIANCHGLKDDDRPLLLTYDGTSSDELIFGLKLGCDGIVQVLLEPVGKLQKQLATYSYNLHSMRQLLSQLLSAHRRVVAVTVFDFTGHLLDQADTTDSVSGLEGIGLVMLETGTQTFELDALPSSVAELLRSEAGQVLQDAEGQSFVLQQEIDGCMLSALIEIVEPITSLVIFGSGQDVSPLLAMTAVLGWRVMVLGNAQVQRLDREQFGALIADQGFSAVVVMTHDYELDKKVLQVLFTGSGIATLPYIGVVGPRRRADKLLAELALAGVPITQNETNRLFSPIGLDLGAERPEEIALSILAEIKAVLAGHRGGLLREKQGPIHEPTRLKEPDHDAASVASAAVEKRTISATCRLNDQ
jgi:xanthine/CO dehydrogenase XdhC/CoxF family maturation factor